MVIRRTFVDALKCSEPPATAAARRLQPIGNGVPAGIGEVARSLNARLVRMPVMSTGPEGRNRPRWFEQLAIEPSNLRAVIHRMEQPDVGVRRIHDRCEWRRFSTSIPT